MSIKVWYVQRLICSMFKSSSFLFPLLNLFFQESISVKESKVSIQRQHNIRKRVVKSGIKRLEKLMNSISSLLSALQQALDGPSCIHEVIVILGGSPARPQHVYELFFPYGRVDSGSAKRKVAEALSRKVPSFHSLHS